MAGNRFTVHQLIKHELAEVSDISAEVKQECFTSENVSSNSSLNGEYALELNSHEFALQNIATESLVFYEYGEIVSTSEMEEVKPRINMENDRNIKNVETKINKTIGRFRTFEHYDLPRIKINSLNKENGSYNLNEVKIESMPIESMPTKPNLVIKEEEIFSDVTHSYSQEPKFNDLQNPDVPCNVLIKYSDDNSGKKNINLKNKSDESNKTEIHMPVNSPFAKEFPEVGSKSNTVTSNFQCSYCGYKCKHEAIFQDHMLSHQNLKFKEILPFSCYICNFQCKHKIAYQTHMKSGHHEMLVCFKCNYSNTSKKQFNLHLAETGHKAFKCSECDFEFDRKIEMRRHMIDHEIKIYECSECKKKMKYKHFKRHLLTHEKPFECSICGYRAGSAKQIKKHMLIHTNEKPYECQVCKRTFRREANLKTHIPTHQNRESRKLYECGVCKKSYTLMQTLKNHYKISNHGPDLLPLMM